MIHPSTVYNLVVANKIVRFPKHWSTFRTFSLPQKATSCLLKPFPHKAPTPNLLSACRICPPWTCHVQAHPNLRLHFTTLRGYHISN